MSAKSYWDGFTQQRLSRRRALVATSAGAASAAFLAACGGDDSGGGSKAPVDRSGLLHVPVDTTAQAKSGGVLKTNLNGDLLHHDGLISTSAAVLSSSVAYAYQRLVKWELTPYSKVVPGTIVGDLAESFEFSPDKLQLTMKIRPGVKWDQRPPTNGRLADAEDVLWSWKKFVALHPGANAYAYAKEPSAPIESLTSPDSRTIVLKMREPNSAVLPQLVSQQFSPQPREAESGFNPRTEVRGNGPFQLEEYTPSVRTVWRRNPDYYVKDRPFIDRVESPIVTDNSQRLAQFRAGNIYTDVLVAAQQDVVTTKKDIRETLMLQEPAFSERSIYMVTYGWEGNSPFKDQRVRQAMSLLIDREAYIDVIDNRQGFAKDGLDLPVAYGTILGAGWTGYWVNPQDEKEFGPNHKYLKFDAAEAKKLIAAAGHPNGFEFDSIYNREGQFPVLNKTRELYNAWWTEAGLRPKQVGVTSQDATDNYSTAYIAKDYAAGIKKGFNGAYFIAERPYGAPALALYGQLHKNGAYYKGMSPDGRNLQNGDPKINDLAEKIRAEFDVTKQQTMTHELIKYFTGQAYIIPQVSQVKSYSLWWPAIGNLGMYLNFPNQSVWSEVRLNWWIDSTKPPIART
ncbi:MAG TPA: ABC transporter substrate-binding protein [Dehalococcoidia bacterium]|nr:ABC transporter substrate-binding protein [Dehalococcoidia bacterium]